MADQGPIFLAGTDRSGIGLLGEMLSAHPRIFVSRRTRFWNFYYERYGDLREPDNLAAVVDEMLRYSRVMDLRPDRDRLLAEFPARREGSGYGTLFALVQQHHLERLGKQRWGDKTLNAERYADVIFREYPTARMIHVLRDPRDRYASQATHRNASRGKVGAGIALWRSSVRLALRNVATYDGRYRIVRYEDLVARPAAVLDEVCRFVGESFDPRMLAVTSSPDDQAAGVGVVTTSIGRFRRDLTRRETALIQLLSGRTMRRVGYEPVAVPSSAAERARLFGLDVPVNLALMAAWWANMRRRERSAGAPSSRRVVAPA